MSKAALRKELVKMSQEQLVTLILDLYSARPQAKEYFEFFLNPDEKELYDKYVKIVEKEVYCPSAECYAPESRISMHTSRTLRPSEYQHPLSSTLHFTLHE